MTRSILFLIAMSALFVATVSLWLSDSDEAIEPQDEFTTELPDFTQYKDVKQKKQAFFEFLLPRVRSANEVVRQQRAFLLSLDPADLSSSEEAELYALAKRYRVTLTDVSAGTVIDRLLVKVDTVPAALILAQGANESAWGTSRFARQGNNLFGLWCFTPGCGLTPLRRNDGATHEVERFTSVQASINKYIRTINSHPAYANLRQTRRRLRDREQPLTGVQLAAGLGQYSERGTDYIEEIQEMIRFNQLERYNFKPGSE